MERIELIQRAKKLLRQAEKSEKAQAYFLSEAHLVQLRCLLNDQPELEAGRAHRAAYYRKGVE